MTGILANEKSEENLLMNFTTNYNLAAACTSNHVTINLA